MTSASLLNNWPHRWFGYFSQSGYVATKLPSLDEVTDPGWTPADRAKLCDYLKRAPVTVTSFERDHKCSLCGAEIGNPTAHQSDGLWLWPLCLPHFVEFHSVRLPDSLVARIRGQRYRIPCNLDIDPASLEWPPS